jgi:hypothetical protein
MRSLIKDHIEEEKKNSEEYKTYEMGSLME